MKKYNVGLVIGRFQPFHKGHEYMIRKALSLCKRVVVLVGSSQESGTKRNPFNYQLRKEMIEKVFKKEVSFNRIIIIPIVDKGYGNSPMWGDYIANACFDGAGENPDLYISGCAEERSNWLNHLSIDQLYLNRFRINISATECRHAIITNSRERYKSMVPKQLYNMYNDLKEIIDEISNSN